MPLINHEIKLQRETFALFVFIPWPMTKTAGGTLSTKTVVLPLVGGLMRTGYYTCFHMLYDEI